MVLRIILYMSNNIKPYQTKDNKLNKGLVLISQFYKEFTIALLQHLINKHGYSVEQISRIPGVNKTGQSIRDHYLGRVK